MNGDRKQATCLTILIIVVFRCDQRKARMCDSLAVHDHFLSVPPD
jgi:hypothetical protein